MAAPNPALNSLPRPGGQLPWLLLAAAVLALSLFWGRYPQPYLTSISQILNDDLSRRIALDIRLPRIISAFFLGMVLSASGTVFQMVFRNPLVDSGFLGVSGGAAFGASLAIVLLGGGVVAVQTSAALFAFIGLGASYAIGRHIRMGDWVLRLVLAGIAVSALFAAGTGVLKYLADPLRELPDLTFWMLGGLWGITWTDTVQILAVASPCLALIMALRWRLNLLSMEDNTAFSLTAAPSRERLVLLLAGVIATAVVVSKAGQIGWVGLIVPHIARRLVGSDAQRALPCALLLGGVFVLICDNISRGVLSGEIPLGILTAFSGAGAFVVLMMRRRIKAEP
jgi:iron complex transport system permease protein